MTHFHVTLPSDSSKDTHPGNTASRFTTKLSDRIELEGEYEVGLAEFTYPHTWYNFKSDVDRYWVVAKTTNGESKTFPFKSGFYPDGTAFATDLNRQTAKAMMEITHMHAHIRFTFNPATLRMTIDTNSRGWLFVSDDFMRFLGFPRGWPANPKPHMTAGRALDLNRGRNLLYVYCDAAAFSIVGDVEAPLMRVCKISGKDGDVVKTIFTHPHYVPLARNNFETIHINISDERGRPIPFTHGKSMVTLHFRPKTI